MKALNRWGAAFVVVGTGLLFGCGQNKPPPRIAAKVDVLTTVLTPYATTVALTGEVSARIVSDLSFTASGRVVERRVDVGAHVTRGQVLATIDPQQQQATVIADEASVEAAQAKLRQSSSAFARQQTLIRTGDTTRGDYDQAEETLRTARTSLDVSNAQLGIARDALSKTALIAPADGIITARDVEAGRVVQAAQAVYTLALDGPRDAVFDVNETIFARAPQDGTIQVALVADPRVQATARPREISPLVDANSGTVKVKFDILNAPPAMTLGAAIVGTGRLPPSQAIILPWSALSSQDGRPAVWVVDNASKAVSLQPIGIDTYEVERIVVRHGLHPGQVVVTRGQQFLSPGEIVAPAEEHS